MAFRKPHESYMKEPIALLWIIVGMFAALGVMVVLESLSQHY
jgi:hypothetical protein